MKRLSVFLISSLILCAFLAITALAETVTLESANVAASATNTTAGTSYFFNNERFDGIRIYVSANSYAATTNGNLTVKFQTSFDGVNWDVPTSSTNSAPIKVLLTGTGTSVSGGTNMTSEWFAGYGINYIRVFSRENTTPGSWSNVTPVIVFTKGR